MATDHLGRMRIGSTLGRTLYVLGPADDLTANPKAGTFIGTVDTPELAEAICAAVNAVHAVHEAEQADDSEHSLCFGCGCTHSAEEWDLVRMARMIKHERDVAGWRLAAIRAEAESMLTGADQGDYGSGQAAMASRVLEILGER